MGRHNTVAGRMASSAEARGKLFTKLARAIIIAARSGTDPDLNSSLRAAIAKAKDNSMPKESIERAIKKGSGEGKEGLKYEEILYEGFGPGGIGVLVEVLTDNRQRTHPELRLLFQKGGGNLGEAGSISWMFQKKGLFVFDSSRFNENDILQIALESGADDIEREGNFIIVACEPTHFAFVRENLLKEKLEFERAGIEFIPNNFVDITEENAQKAQSLMGSLNAHDDVQNVYTNAIINC